MIDVENRLTDGITRARLRLEMLRSIRPFAWLVIGVVVAGLGFSYIAGNVGIGFTTSTHTVRFAVDDATGVVAGRVDVRLKGVPVGKVTAVDHVDGRAVLTAEVRAKHGRIFRDARAAVRPNTALMDMYLNIVDRGTESAGEASGSFVLPARQTDTTVRVAHVLQAFDPDVRGNLATMLDEMGRGLDDRGKALREAFVRVAPFLDVATKMTDQLHAQGTATRRLVTNFAVLNEELARRDRDLRELAVAGGSTFRTLQAGSDDLRRTLRELPPTLGTMDSSFTALNEVLPDVDDAVQALRPVADELPRALTAVTRLSGSAGPAFRALKTPVRRLVPLATELRPLADDLSTAIGDLRPQVGALDHISKTVAGCSNALYGFFQWTPSLLKLRDSRGAYPRGQAVVSIGSSSVLRDPSQFRARGCAPGEPKGPRP